MPIYEYECPICKDFQEMYFSIEGCPDEIKCRYCTSMQKKIISRPQAIKPDWEPYYDEVLDTMITGRQHRRELMKAQGLIDKPKDHTKERIELQKRRHKKREELRNGD